jgi:hypothetical protein
VDTQLLRRWGRQRGIDTDAASAGAKERLIEKLERIRVNLSPTGE